MKLYNLLFVFLISSSAMGEPFDLYKAYSEALKNNHTLKATYQKGQITKKEIDEALAPLLPTVYATYSKNRYLSSSSTNSAYKNNKSDYGSESYELKVTQTLYNMPAFSEYLKSKISDQIAQMEYYSKMQELLLEVVVSYTEYLSAIDKLELAKLKIDTLFEQKIEVEKRFDLGDATIQDLEDTKAKYLLAQSNEIEMQLSKEIAKVKLEQITGAQWRDEDIVSLKHYQYLEESDDLGVLIEKANEYNLQLQIKQLTLKYGQKDLESKQEEYYPKVDLIGSSSYYQVDVGATSSEEYHNRQNYLGVQLIAPLYQGGATASKIKVAQERNTQVNEELKALKQEVQLSVIKEYKGLKTIQSQMKSYKSALESAQLTYDAAKIGYDLRTRTHFEVLQAVEQVYMIKNALLDLKHNFLNGQLKLKMLVGTLSSNDLLN